MESSCNKEEIIHNDSWNILVVDDNNFIHVLFKEMLKDFKFEEKSINIISAFSTKEAMEILSKEKDIAVIFLDIFLDERDSGFKLSKYIREVLRNFTTRIILMTGKGTTKLRETAILNYDINGYEDKDNLFNDKLYIVLVSALRSYRDILHIDNNKKIMEQVVASSSKLLASDSLENFMSSTLCYLSSIINKCRGRKCSVNGLGALRSFDERAFSVVKGLGKYANGLGNKIMDTVSKEDFQLIKKVYRKKDYTRTNNRYISYYNSSSGVEGIIYLEIDGDLSYVDRELLSVFNKNILAAFESLCLNKEIEKTQREILYLLGEATEARSEETGNHVKRVSEYCRILAEKYGLSKREVMLITMAAPIHDIGKVAIPDNILMKPGKLTREEFNIVKTHTTIGYNILKHSNRDILKAAAIIAHEHHERYDGKGYPQGLKGEEIHIFGRIAAVADVFDALGSPRVYKKPWVIEDILNYFRQEKGKHFDPVLVDILFDNLDEFLEVKEKHKDESKFQITGHFE